jgi:hypothetical protein
MISIRPCPAVDASTALALMEGPARAVVSIETVAMVDARAARWPFGIQDLDAEKSAPP